MIILVITCICLAAIQMDAMSGMVATQYYRFEKKTELFGKSCAVDESSFMKDGVWSEFRCTYHCTLTEDCTSIFFSKDTGICHGCKLAYKQNANLASIMTGSEYFERVCDEGWFRFQDKCYFFDGPPIHYSGAKVFCAGFGSHLVQVETKEENEFLKAQLRSRVSSLCSGLTMCCIWNALYQYANNGQETWTPDGPALTYTDWGNGEPYYNDKDGRELCTCFYGDNDFKWSDVACDFKFIPLCEQ